MVDKNVFTQELSKVFTILQEVRLVEKYIKELIDNNNLTEDKVVEFEEKLNHYKRDLDYINENTEQLQESLNQMNINIEDLMEYVDSIKDFINQNENTTEVGGNLEVDGNITINSVDNLITKDGSTFGGGGSGSWREVTFAELKTFIQNNNLKEIFIRNTSNIPNDTSTSAYNSPIMPITNNRCEGTTVINSNFSAQNKIYIIKFYVNTTTCRISVTTFNLINNEGNYSVEKTTISIWNSDDVSNPPSTIYFYVKD